MSSVIEQIEEWRPVLGFIGYEASNFGRVRSVDRKSLRAHPANGKICEFKRKGQMLNPILHRGYLVVKLGHPNMARGVHQAVALAFLGLPPVGHVVNHKDGVKTNNIPENLEYVTDPENVKHAYRTGLLSNKGETNGKVKLTDENVALLRLERKKGRTLSQLAIMFGITKTHVSRLVANKLRSVIAS